MEGVLLPFKKIPEVHAWKEQYTAPEYATNSRFKFLLLEGNPSYGKRRFACSLFGRENTYVCNCQGLQQLCLAGFDNKVHKAIVLDEPSAELVENCKAFLQAGVDGCELYQSPTQSFTRWFCVWKVPIIICTNDWIGEDSSIDSSLAQWIGENSVHYSVKDYLYEKPAESETTTLVPIIV